MSAPPNWMHQQRPEAHRPNRLQGPKRRVSANQGHPWNKGWVATRDCVTPQGSMLLGSGV